MIRQRQVFLISYLRPGGDLLLQNNKEIYYHCPSKRGRTQYPIKSHIRVEGNDRVYVVDGFLSMLFSTNPDQYKKREPTQPAK
jgi:hypothetical protein